MKAPDPGIDKLPVFILGTGMTNPRLGEHTMTAIQPAIRAPNETVESFVPVLNTPAIEKNFMGTVGFIVPIGIGNKNEFGGHANIDTTHADREAGAESQVLGKSLLLIKHTIPVHILKNLNAVSLVRTMGFPGLIIVILQGPKTAPEIEAKGNRFTNVRLGYESFDLKTLQGLHIGNGLIGCEKRCVASLRFSPSQKERQNQKER